MKIATYILTILLLAESAYILLARHPINRFKSMDNNGYVAFDSATGRLCRTYQTTLVPKSTVPVPSASNSSKSGSKSGDAILDMIQDGKADPQTIENPQVEFVRSLPACEDLR